MSSASTGINQLASCGRAFTIAQAAEAGVSHQLLTEYCRKGVFLRQGGGVYIPADNYFSEHPEVEILQKRGTEFVLCLLSALRFHDFTTQNPTEIWLAVRQGSRSPCVSFSVNCIHFSDAVYEYGVEEHHLNDLPVKVYSPAKTVADCFKFRNRYGLELALEALRDGWRQHKFTVDELKQAALVDRVQKVMTPYMEMMINEP